MGVLVGFHLAHICSGFLFPYFILYAIISLLNENGFAWID